MRYRVWSVREDETGQRYYTKVGEFKTKSPAMQLADGLPTYSTVFDGHHSRHIYDNGKPKLLPERREE